MKKRFSGVALKRKKGAKKGLLHSLVRALVLKEKMKTTETKAKVIAPVVEKMITKAKRGGLACYRQLIAEVDGETAKKLVEVIALKYKGVNGGYTRITKLTPRKSDAAKMAIIELV